VTLNIQFARRIGQAIELFARSEELARASLVLLQEMDPEGTDRLAAALAMNYVYYPATVHVRTGRDFGNAVLARWPIAGDRKVTLPHRSVHDGSPRAATVATVATPRGPLEVASVHIATRLELPPAARRAQLAAVLGRLTDARHAVLGGDLNSYGLGRLAAAAEFDWTTREVGGALRRLFSIDHIFARGLRAAAVGRVTATRAATDHPAVWARLVWT
jgi:endonuclease/exonuclease/phosphatase family metal-dependent hydrolase